MSSEERELRSALEACQAALTQERALSEQLRADKSSMQARLNELEQKERELSFQLEALKQPAPFKPDKSAPWIGRDSTMRGQKGPIHWSVLSVILAIVAALNAIVIFSSGKAELRGVVLWANLMALTALALFIGVRALR
jgi:hypothetical protein